MAADVLVPPSTDGSRVSRYRSVRKAQQQQSREPAPPLPTANMAHTTDSQSVSRSASRYHRPKTAVDRSVPMPAPLSATQVAALSAHSSSRTDVNNDELPRPAELAPPVIAPRTQESSERLQTNVPPVEERTRPTLEERQERMRAAQLAEWEALGRAAESDRLRQEREKEAREEEERLYQEQVERVERKRRQEEEAAEQEKRRQLKEREKAVKALEGDRQRPRREFSSQPTEARPSTAKHSNPSDPPPISTIMGFFKRRRSSDSTRAPDKTQPSPRATVEPRPKTSHAPQTPSSPKEETIRPGGGGVVPGTDAPISAVNHGVRRVMIECGKSRIRLPISPDTTPIQLIRSASTVLSEPIDPRASLLMETFTKASVERPLRMYEHVRDVMNSWDNDDQHNLVIIPSTPDGDNELYASFASKTEPKGGSWELHYSNKRGKWDKRHIKLRRDGQLVYEKGKTEINICHLSDFDIYTPIPRMVKTKVKPPKKYCYGVKSQQKSSIFENNTNFIHMFCTNDQKAANGFYRAVHTWRSWYLVDVMGEGGKNGKAGTTKGLNGTASTTSKKDSKMSAGEAKIHGRNLSEDSHYILGSFNDLGIDPSSFRYSNEPMSQQLGQQPSQSYRHRRRSSADSDAPLGIAFPEAVAAAAAAQKERDSTQAMHARKISQRMAEKSSPPVSYPAHMIQPSQDSSTGSGSAPPRTSASQTSDSSEAFSATGLLGKEYNARKEALNSNGVGGHLKRADSIHSSRSQSQVYRRNSVASADHPSAPRRDSGRVPPKPLIDLTPQYKEPPQFSKKGHGYKPKVIGEGGLIDAVPQNTNIEDAIKIPRATTWKRPVTSAGPGTAASSGRYKGWPQHAPPSSASPSPPPAPHAYDRTKSLRGHGAPLSHQHYQQSSLRSPNVGAGAPFTGDGLLAKSKGGWGSGSKGHGVLSGNMAKGPMVDLGEGSKFAEGSLLRQAERRRA